MNKQNLCPTKWSMAIFIAMVVLAGSVFAVGQTERVVYRFHGGNDGADPDGGLISDQAGNFYGAVRGGGAHDYGAIFQMSPPAGQGGHWTESVIYNFTGGNDGGVPTGELIFDQAGNLYGMALLGGSTGGGTVFELTPRGGTWTETAIYNFQSNDQPVPGVVFDKAGNLYGATAAGGGHGSVFQLAPSQGGGWTETTIYSFGAAHKGRTPLYGPAINRAGNLYGLLQYGSTGASGGVYQLKAPAQQGGAWTERVLYSFKGGSDGGNPSGGLVFDQKGNLYGVSQQGGAFRHGTVFQLVRQGSSWSKTLVYSFCSQHNCRDGFNPMAGLLTDNKGNLYGTTALGGAVHYGTVFQLTPPAAQGDPWTQTVLHNFTNLGGDGNGPATARLIRGKFGSLWGTTTRGGKTEGECARTLGCGTVFNVVP